MRLVSRFAVLLRQIPQRPPALVTTWALVRHPHLVAVQFTTHMRDEIGTIHRVWVVPDPNETLRRVHQKIPGDV